MCADTLRPTHAYIYSWINWRWSIQPLLMLILPILAWYSPAGEEEKKKTNFCAYRTWIGFLTETETVRESTSKRRSEICSRFLFGFLRNPLVDVQMDRNAILVMQSQMATAFFANWIRRCSLLQLRCILKYTNTIHFNSDPLLFVGKRIC